MSQVLRAPRHSLETLTRDQAPASSGAFIPLDGGADVI